MNLVLTLVGSAPLDPTAVASLIGTLGATRAEKLGARAVDLYLAGDLRETREAARALADPLGADAIVQPVETRRKALLVSDMDSTLIGQECIDELAAVHDLKPRVAAITERAMRGELDFAAALVERVALLKGIPEASVADLLARVIVASPGAATLVATCRAKGIRTVLVSGGFVQFAGPVAARLGMDAHFANTLDVADGLLAGTVAEPILGAEAKRERLAAETAALGVTPDETIALGDGANDLPMLEAAGLGLAYRAKPKVAAAADGLIAHTDLTTALYAMGIPQAEFTIPEGTPDA